MTSRENLKRTAPEKECDKLRKRRRRTAFTDEQLDRLEESFENERFPGIQTREDLARELNIGEDRIQVWFQSRRARWRKQEIKNKPAPAYPASEKRLVSSHVDTFTMFQPSPAIFPPLHSAPFRPWESFYPPFKVSPLFPPRHSFASEPLRMENNILPAASLRTQASQSVSTLVHPRVSSPASPPSSSSTSSLTSLETLYQASCVYGSDIRESRHSAADCLAAVTLASGFQREI